MTIEELLKGVECTCGKHHTCDIKNVYIENNVHLRLEGLCEGFENILMIADENTYFAGGCAAAGTLGTKLKKLVMFSGDTVLVPNEEAVAKVDADMEGIELIIGVGSGVIQDLSKFVAFSHKIPYFVIATAPSMDGYASDGAAMIMEGMKVTYPAKVPSAILAEPAVLANAPIDMIKAGYGDILGKFSALNDWKLSNVVNGEYFCEFIYNLTYDSMMKTLNLSDGLLKRDEESIAALMEALVTVGIAMSFAGSSRPASGSEHHFSHFFEITGIVDGTEYLPHGLDVAYSTVLTAKIREKILENDFSGNGYVMPDDEYREKMADVYKTSAEGCIKLQEKVGRYKENRMDIYRANEDKIRSILSEMPTAEKIISMLEDGGIYMDDFYKVYSKKQLENAVVFAKELKDRYTVLWMHYDMFGCNTGGII